MLLTITIPTYKRPELLHKNLVHIFEQAAAHEDVSVLVLDDSDGSANAPWIARVRAQFPQARLDYVVNERNLGIDENIKNCILSARSEYVWLLGEDDLLTAGALDKVRTALLAERPGFLFANYIYCDDAHARTAESPVLPGGQGYSVIAFDAFAAANVWALGFIGGCVLRATDWKAQDVAKFTGSYYSHVGGIIDASVGRDIVVMRDVLVLNRAEDVNTFTWSKSTFDVYFSFYDVLRKSRLSADPTLLARCESAAAHLFKVYSLPWLAAKRADGVYDSAAYGTYYAGARGQGAGWHLAARALAAFPRGPLRMLRRIHLRKRFSHTVATHTADTANTVRAGT
jgi:glycosyltransferase involved in cell wall biosynthesis